jgi:hypothetical protein
VNDWARAFCSRLALFAVHGPIHPLENDAWLMRFIHSANAKHIVMWAERVEQLLAGLDSEGIVNVWHKWLRDYWDARNGGRPVPVTSDEAWAMLEWFPGLSPVAGDALECVKGMPVANPPSHTELYRRLSKMLENGADPGKVAEFLLLSLKGQSSMLQVWYCPDVVEAAERALYSIPDESRVSLGQPIIERLFEVGCISQDRAEELLKKLGVVGVSEDTIQDAT